MRRKKKNKASIQAPLSKPVPPVPLPISVEIDNGITIPPLDNDALNGALEKATERAKYMLAFCGEIRPTAFFVYTDNIMKAVSLSFKNEFYKDILIRKIREKVIAEKAFAVLIMTEEEFEGHKVIMLSGETPGMSASVRVRYVLDKDARTISSWEIHRLDIPYPNVVIEDIFGATGATSLF